jgi:hypothetical protein
VDENSLTLQSQKNVFSPRTTVTMSVTAQQQAKKQALDLIDALTRSGGLPLTHTSLHVVVATTHVFDHSVMETLVQRDVNPLERLQQSMLVMLQTLHDKPASALVQSHARASLALNYASLFTTNATSHATTTHTTTHTATATVKKSSEVKDSEGSKKSERIGTPDAKDYVVLE